MASHTRYRLVVLLGDREARGPWEGTKQAPAAGLAMITNAQTSGGSVSVGWLVAPDAREIKAAFIEEDMVDE